MKQSIHSVRKARAGAVIETLESRRLLSADLSAAFAGSIPALLPAEGKTQLALRITNIGDAPAKGLARIQVVASIDAIPDGGDVLLASVNKRLNLQPGKGKTVKLRVPAPRALPAGDYVLIAQVTGQVTAGDARAENNFAASGATAHVQSTFVDLAAQNVGVPQVTAHGSQQVSVDVKNLGNITARGAVSARWYLSSDTTVDGSDILVGAVAKRLKIAPGKSQMLAAPASLGSNVPLGTYYLIAVISPAPALGDNNAANNTAIAPTTVQVVQPPPQHHEHNHDHMTEIVSEAYYEQVYVVQYVDTQIATEPVDDGGGGQMDQPEDGQDVPTDGPVSQPSTQPSDGPPTSQPSEAPTTQPSDEPTTQPSEEPTTQPSEPPPTQPSSDPPSQDTSGGGTDNGNYTSSGGDF